MKKKLVASLAAAMVLGVAGTSFAATNPFVDVPAKHWAYDSVTKLAQAGIVDGYNDGTFRGDKNISRYEMAQIVAKAMARSDKADAAQKAMIDKLSVEFASELEGLNVRVNKLEKNASSVKLTGEARIRYEDTNFAPKAKESGNSNALVLRTRLAIGGNINDDWSYAGRIENNQDFYKSSADNKTEYTIATVRGHIAGIDTTIGRQEYMPNYGLLLDTAMDGVKFSFGNVLKTNVYYGRNDLAGVLLADKHDILGADFKYAMSTDTNLTAGAYQFDNGKATNSKIKAYEVGFDTKISADWTAKAGYGTVKEDGKVNDNNKASFVGFDYKAADTKKVGSYAAFVNYRNIEENAQLVPTFDQSVVRAGEGGKGYEVGFKYVPMTNSLFVTKYVDLKSTVNNKSDQKAKYYQAQVEFFF